LSASALSVAVILLRRSEDSPTCSVRADQIIAGTILNIGAFGLTAYFNKLIITQSGLGGAGVLPGVLLGLGARQALGLGDDKSEQAQQHCQQDGLHFNVSISSRRHAIRAAGGRQGRRMPRKYRSTLTTFDPGSILHLAVGL